MSSVTITVEELLKIISDNSLLSASVLSGIALLYKIYRILKADTKIDELDEVERIIRQELRDEILLLKKEIKELIEDQKSLFLKNKELEKFILEMKIHIKTCASKDECPLKDLFTKEPGEIDER